MRRYISHFGFAFRIIAKTPMISVLSILVLAISIALATLMFNLVTSVLMAKLPYKDGERLVRVERINPGNRFSDRNMPFNSYRELLELQQVFDGTIAFFQDGMVLRHEGTNSMAFGAYVTPDFLDILGVDLKMGRRFVPEDALAESEPVIIISESVWNDVFGGDPAAIGKPLEVDGLFHTVVGIAPEGFDFPMTQKAWIPLNLDTVSERVGWGSSVWLLGRTKDGLSAAGASAQLNEVFKRIKEKYPVENEEFEFVRLVNYKDFMIGDGTVKIFMAMGICAVLVLLMGCAIASNLITVRCSKRANELAIRSALGASRAQNVVLLLFESLITTTIAFVLGWLLTEWFSRQILEPYFLQFRMPSWIFNESYSVIHLLFVIGIIVFVTLTSTLIPALRGSRTNLNDLLKDSTRTGSSLRLSLLGRLLIIFQIAAAFAVVSGGSMVGYFLHNSSDAGSDYDPHEYLYATLVLNTKDHNDSKTKVQLFEQVKKQLLVFPEVKGVTYSTEFHAGRLMNPIKIEGVDYGSSDTYPQVFRHIVGPDYFKVMQIPLISGREFNEFDTNDSPRVAVVTDVFARQFWGNEDPLGKRFTCVDTTGEWSFELTVVGVVKDLFGSDRNREHRTGFFNCAYQDPWMALGLHIHLPDDASSFEPNLVQTVADIDSRALLTNIGTIYDRTQSVLLIFKFVFVIFVTFAVGALLMAAAGLYGVVSFSVSQRIREIGIRLALGAEPLRVVRDVFAQGFINVIIGILIGVGLAYVLRFLLMNVLNPFSDSLVVYLGVLLGILFLSSISILIPSIRGGTTDPAEALRID